MTRPAGIPSPGAFGATLSRFPGEGFHARVVGGHDPLPRERERVAGAQRRPGEGDSIKFPT